MGRIIGFAIWMLFCLIFVLIGISAWHAKEPTGFFTFAKPPEIKNIKRYNRAVARLWFVFAGGMTLLGFPLLAARNSPLVIISILGSSFFVIIIAIVYFRIESKYRKR